MYEVSEETSYTYTLYDGTEILYYLDNAGMPYILENGEIIYAMLPLDHLLVTDEKLINELNASLFLNRSISNYIDLSLGSPSLGSDGYVENVTLNSTYTSPVFKYNTNHSQMRLQMTDVKTNSWFSSTKVDLIIYQYNAYTSKWYENSYSNYSLTGTLGAGFQQDTAIINSTINSLPMI